MMLRLRGRKPGHYGFLSTPKLALWEESKKFHKHLCFQAKLCIEIQEASIREDR